MPTERGAVMLTPPSHHWECDCGRTAVTHERRPHSQMHACALVGGLLAPYRPAGARGKLTAAIREDYEAHAGRLGAETLQRDSAGRPHVSVTAEYDLPDGSTRQHVALFVPGININIGL